MRTAPRLVQVTTVDLSLELLLGPQLRAFRDAGYEVIGASAPGPWVEVLERDGIAHVPLAHATRAWSPHRDLLALRELYQLFRRLRPDIVHTHNPKPGVYGRIAARLAGVPAIVNTVHGLYAQPGDPWAKRAACYTLERLAATCSGAELVQNRDDLEVLRRLRIPERRLHLLGNGVDLDRFDPGRFTAADRRWARRQLGASSADQVVVGCVARLVREKGIPELIAAVGAVAAHDPRVHLAIVGPRDASRADDIGDDLIERARASGVTLLGERRDVDRLYLGMDLFALPSHREGFPRSVMEASAMGVPVVATDIRGCREAVVPDVTGRLVAAGDADALAAVVAHLVSDDAERARLGRGARALAVERFDVQRQVELTLAAYADLGVPAPGTGCGR